MTPKILSRKIKYKGFWAKIEEAKIKLPTKKVVKWQYVVANDVVAIVAIDGEKNIYFSKEWRPTFNKEIVEIPVGLCKGRMEKQILLQAKNELREETGFDAKKWQKLITCFLGGREKRKIHIFLATNLFEFPKERDEEEIVKVVKKPFNIALGDFLRGKILTTSYTIAGMMLAKERLKL